MPSIAFEDPRRATHFPDPKIAVVPRRHPGDDPVMAAKKYLRHREADPELVIVLRAAGWRDTDPANQLAALQALGTLIGRGWRS